MKTLTMKRDKQGIISRKKGDKINYKPWHNCFQGLSEQERVDIGMFVHCYGQGEFEVLTNNDVEVED